MTLPLCSLIELYIDIEFTDRHNTFYEKFSTRYQIGEILGYLWNLPQVRSGCSFLSFCRCSTRYQIGEILRYLRNLPQPSSLSHVIALVDEALSIRRLGVSMW